MDEMRSDSGNVARFPANQILRNEVQVRPKGGSLVLSGVTYMTGVMKMTILKMGRNDLR